MAEKNVRVALREVLEELTGKPPRLSCALENSGEWSRCDLIFESMRIGYRNRQGGASAGSTVWHSWLTTPAAHAPLIACGAVVFVEAVPAHTITPAEAVEALYARETPLWPWSPGDDAAPRWWCEACDGTGERRRIRPGRTSQTGLVCECGGRHDAEPQSLASFVAVASLGVPTLRNAYGLAAQLVGRAPRVTFRVMAREALREFNEASVHSSAIGLSDEACIVLASRESHCMAQNGSPNAWPVECPFRFRPIVAAWPVLRDLAALGLHLVALDGDRVTLAVEAL